MSFLQRLTQNLFGGAIAGSNTQPLIVTAQVNKITKHPNADRLRVVELNISTYGDDRDIIEPVVCGATNFNEGDIVALALPGARIAQNIHSEAYESFTLEKATIRGVESQGMICSGFELGFRDTPETREEGILIFPPGTKLGEDVYELMPTK